MTTDTERLDQALARAARGLAREQPPAALWPRVQAALPPPHPPRRMLFAPAAMACVALLAVSAAWIVFEREPAQPMAARRAEPAFVALAGADRLRQVAQAGDGQAWLVTTELPRERLAMLGLPYDPTRAGERVRAELLMQASGDVLAVRVLQ